MCCIFLKLEMKKLLLGIGLLGCLASCGGKVNTDTAQMQQDVIDSVEVVVDSLLVEEVVEEPIVPVAVDESFADFLYHFALDEKMQRKRLVYPLPYYTDNRKDSIEKEEWIFDPMFSQEESYSMLYDELEDADLEKDTAATSVRVEWIYLKTDKIKRYYFERIKGLWTLEAIDDASIPQEELTQEDFYEFYERFATDSVFQAERVADPLAFVAPDPEDEFQILESTLEKGQWFAFQPKLPNEYLTNINYGQRLDRNSQNRVIELRGFGNGFCNLLHFRCRNGEWKLVRFEDLSN